MAEHMADLSIGWAEIVSRIVRLAWLGGVMTAACGAHVMAEAAPPVLSISADYPAAAGPLDKARLLNGSVGGYEPMQNLNWLPAAYDKLAAIGMRMIRLDHLVNDKFYRVVGRDGGGKLCFDFSRLDRVIRPLLQKGMTPLMCLSYCPDVLIPAGGGDGSVPNSMDEWRQVAQAYVQHYKDLGHTGWYWEVWNEPDNPGFFKGSTQQYHELYASTAAGIKAADPKAKVGGAADASVLSTTARLKPLLDWIKQHPEVPLDYISYHKYGGSMLDEKPPYDLEWNIDEVSAMLSASGLPPREIFVTEWNLTPVMDAGAGADTDTHRMAAGAAARMYNALQHPALTKVFYFSPIEGYNADRVFNGDLGLLTVNGHRKAIYNVFRMFANLGDTLVVTRVSGPNTHDHATHAMVTKNAGRQVAVMLWNYADQAVAVDLTIEHLPYASGGENVRLTHYQVDADHANYFNAWHAGRRGDPGGPTEELEPMERRIITASSSFKRSFTLPAFGVVEILLDPVPGNMQPGILPLPRTQRQLNHAAAMAVTASSSLEQAGWGTTRAVDAITHSLPRTLGWSSAGADTPDQSEWICVDLGRVMPVDSVRLYPRDDQRAEGGGFPVDFKIQTSSDLKQWTDVDTRAGYCGGNPVLGPQSFSFPVTRCRYLRVLATKLNKVPSGARPYRFQLTELEVFGKDG